MARGRDRDDEGSWVMPAVMAPVGSLVGREGDVAVLDRALAEVGEGRAVGVTVVGEPGIGKSRLLRELCRRAGLRGCAVFEGRASELEQEVPFGLVVDALDPWLGRLPSRMLAGMSLELMPELGSIFPSLAGSFEMPAGGPQVERFRCHQALRVLLETLASTRPVVFAFDDVHWADQASVEFLTHLMRRRPRAAVLLAVGYRPRQAAPRLLKAIAAASDEGSLFEVQPRRLTEAEAGRLLGDRLDEGARRALFRESGGNPFYLEELARVVRGRSRSDRRPLPGAAPLVLPRSIRAAVADELMSLTDPARRFLEGAAVAGEPFDPSLAGEIAQIGDRQAPHAIEELLRHDLIRKASMRGYLSFRHPVMRRAVYDGAGPGWRLAAHERAALALARRAAPATRRAHHVERAARLGDDDAIQLLTQAARSVAAPAPATAACWFQAALRLVIADDDPRRLELLISLATVLGALGWFSESRAALAEALELVPGDLARRHAGLAAVRGRIVGCIAGLDHMLGRRADARAVLVQALGEIHDQGSALVSLLKLELAVDHWFVSEWTDAAARAREALDGLAALGDRAAEAEAGAVLALGEYNAGASERARRALDAAQRVADKLEDPQLDGRVRALVCLAHTNTATDRFEQAVHDLERGQRVARVTGQPQWFVPLHAYLSVVRILQGRLREASGAAETAMEAAVLVDNPHSQMWALSMRSWAARLQGELPAALRLAEEAIEVVANVPASLLAAYPGCMLGTALMEAGELDRGQAELLIAAGGPDLPELEPWGRAYWYEILVRAELAQDRVAQADAWVARAEDAAERFPSSSRTAVALRARAALLLARGDGGASAGLAAEAARGFELPGWRLEAALTRALLGRALEAAGERKRAVHELERAHAGLAQCGAARSRDEVARDIRRLGHRVSRPRRRNVGGEGIDALSGREREAAELVTEGKTNREIALELFVSERTVETYLSRASAKLGVSSRAALAGAFARDHLKRSDVA